MKHSKWAFLKDLQDEISLVALENAPQPKKFYWNGSESYYYLDSGFDIIREFTVDLNIYDDEIEQLTILLHKTYPPNSEILASGGWLAPSGKFYPCFYCQHDKWAIKLSAIYYDSLDGAQMLEDKGWIHVSDSGYAMLFNRTETATQAQIDSLMDIYNISEDEKFKEAVMHDINRFAD